ncbi:hypothetical protein [Pseudomonas sp. 18173]|uniref:hypothetical protein n=1 Tax=Pseudomonas sp. 18173 TaxID=3390055 RepID=UPI003D198D03
MKKTDTASVHKKFCLLIDILKAPEKHETMQMIRDALITQQKFAKLSDPENQIIGCSLNSFKSAADIVIPGGFSAIDKLRQRVLKKLSSEPPPPPERADTVRSLQEKNKRHQENIKHLEEHILRLSYVHRKVMQMYERVAYLPPELIKPVYLKDRGEIYTLISTLDLTEFWSSACAEPQ